MRRFLLLALLLLPLALGGCGTKGPLYMPDHEKKTD
ncbi:LPS translocon maturation chaperone LptM [Thiolapillus sp.]